MAFKPTVVSEWAWQGIFILHAYNSACYVSVLAPSYRSSENIEGYDR